MSWSHYIPISDFHQQLALHDHASRLRKLATTRVRRDAEVNARLQELEQEVLELGAGVAALVGLLREKKLATDEEITDALDLATREAERALAVKAEAKRERTAVRSKEAAARKLEHARRRRRAGRGPLRERS